MLKKLGGNIDIIIIFFLGTLLFGGGLGIDTNLLQFLGAILGFLLLVLIRFWKRKLEIPKGFLIYILFLIILVLGAFWSVDLERTIKYSASFFTGGLFWLNFYNLQDRISTRFEHLLLILGLLFGGFLIIHLISGVLDPRPWSVYSWTSPDKTHNHIGDLWALVGIVVFYQWNWKRPLLNIIFLGLTIFFLALSQSRSAYLALATGIGFIVLKQGWNKKNKSVIISLVILVIFLFLYSGLSRTTLFSRPYFLVGTLGLITSPFGVGMGNFGEISSRVMASFPWTANYITSFAHNILLEVFAGIGILGLIFIAWLTKVCYSLFRDGNEILFKALFFALLTNFMFDTTYLIPSMVWLWFASLGLAQLGSGGRIADKN